ncbi:hypothetical protein VLK31_15550 [Variovorax sp. H27-G14]|uniref:hypothetical protein n=1 Tax=Variovorax sp. H27-G14 TaxID=3111914 RepID=UPI0038FCC00B
MKPAICEKHGIQNFVVTSSDFFLAIDEGKIPGPIDACKIKTSAFERISENFVSRHFFQRFFKDSEISEVHLIDREKNLKKMNDRLLIRKIFSDSDLKYVCPACLHQFLKNSN